MVVHPSVCATIHFVCCRLLGAWIIFIIRGYFTCGTSAIITRWEIGFRDAFAIIAFMFYALLPWVLPSITDLFFRGDDAEAYLTTGDDIVEADSLLKTPA